MSGHTYKHKHRPCPCGCGELADECMRSGSALNAFSIGEAMDAAHEKAKAERCLYCALGKAHEKEGEE